jgi:hypothetical protein
MPPTGEQQQAAGAKSVNSRIRGLLNIATGGGGGGGGVPGVDMSGFQGGNFAAGAERQAARQAFRQTERRKSDRGEEKKGGGGGRRGGGGGGGGKRGGPQFSVQESELEGKDIGQQIKEQFQGILSGELGSFTKERADLLKQQLRQDAFARERTAAKSLNADLIRRGVFRSGIAARTMRELKLNTLAEVTRGEREIAIQQLAAEFQDRMAGLQLAQGWLDSLRRYELGKEQIAATREASRAQIALGYAQIAASERNASRQAGVARARLNLDERQFRFQATIAAENHVFRQAGSIADMFV